MTDLQLRYADSADLLRIDLARDAQGFVFRLLGELDLGTAPELERQLQQAWSEAPERVVIDLLDLRFMDSTGLALMIRAQQTATAVDSRLLLRRGSTQVQRLFDLTGVTDRFSFDE